MHIGLKLNQEIHIKDSGSKNKLTLNNIAVNYKYQINIRCGFDNMHDILCCDICNSDNTMCDIYEELKKFSLYCITGYQFIVDVCIVDYVHNVCMHTSQKM